MPKVSAIVPVYNVEKYLNRCVDSILNQTFTDFELILVDDGSPDNSGKICDEYAEKDSRVKVIHKENGGVSVARNLGIETSVGEYITFIDSDDWIEAQMFEQLYNAAENCDIIFCGFSSIGFRNTIVYDLEDIKADNRALADLYVNSSKIKPCFPTVWAKFYRAEIIKSNNLFFDSDIPSGEDTIFNIIACRYCQKAAFVEASLYNYERRNVSSATRKYFYKTYEYKNAIYQTISQWLSQYEFEVEKSFYAPFISSAFIHYLMNCGMRLSIYHFKRIYNIEKTKILDNAHDIDEILGGGYASLLKKEHIITLVILWKLRHIKFFIKRIIKSVLKI